MTLPCHEFHTQFFIGFLVHIYAPRRVQTIECNLKSIKKYIFISSHNPLFFWFCSASVFMMLEWWCTRKSEEREDNVPSEKLCPMWVALIGLPCHRNTQITTYLEDLCSMIYISLKLQWKTITFWGYNANWYQFIFLIAKITIEFMVNICCKWAICNSSK